MRSKISGFSGLATKGDPIPGGPVQIYDSTPIYFKNVTWVDDPDAEASEYEIWLTAQLKACWDQAKTR